jgi:hypothetical protein
MHPTVEEAIIRTRIVGLRTTAYRLTEQTRRGFGTLGCFRPSN